jgi:hypothetical protein
MLSRDVGADSAIAEELAVGAESRLAADPEPADVITAEVIFSNSSSNLA